MPVEAAILFIYGVTVRRLLRDKKYNANRIYCMPAWINELRDKERRERHVAQVLSCLFIHKCQKLNSFTKLVSFHHFKEPYLKTLAYCKMFWIAILIFY